MEHIIHFGVTIDDDKIEKMVADKACEEVMKQIKRSTEDFTRKNYYSDSRLTEIFKEEVKKIVEENKDEIIKKVIETVSRNMMKTKAIVNAKTEIIDKLGVE